MAALASSALTGLSANGPLPQEPHVCPRSLPQVQPGALGLMVRNFLESKTLHDPRFISSLCREGGRTGRRSVLLVVLRSTIGHDWHVPCPCVPSHLPHTCVHMWCPQACTHADQHRASPVHMVCVTHVAMSGYVWVWHEYVCMLHVSCAECSGHTHMFMAY